MIVGRPALSDVLDQLRHEGLLDGDVELPPEEAPSPWYIRLVAAAGTWLAGLFFLIFVGATGLIDDEGGALVSGALLIGISLGLLRLPLEPARHLGLAWSLCGHGLFLLGIAQITRDELVTGLVAIVLGVVLIPLASSAVHRFASVWMASMAAHYVCYELDIPSDVAMVGTGALAAAWWLFEARLQRTLLGGAHASVGYGLAFALLVGLAPSLWHGDYAAGPATTIVLLALLAGVTVQVLREHDALRGPPAAFALASVIGVGSLTLTAPGIVGAALVLALGFTRRAPVLAGLAIAFLVTYGIGWYYWMDLGLVEKAGVLLSTGALLLAVRLLQRRLWPSSDAAAEPVPVDAWRLGLVGLGLVVCLGVPAGLMADKEMTLRTGQRVLLELAPRDPRSLMQGDYMRLRYALTRRDVSHWPERGHVVVRLDDADVASFVRRDEGGELAEDEVRLAYTIRKDQLFVAVESYFFTEGQAQRFDAARYGELRVRGDGQMVLVGLRDAQRQGM